MRKSSIKLEKSIDEDTFPAVMYLHTKDKVKGFNNYKGKFLECDNDEYNKELERKFNKHFHKELEINYLVDGRCDYYIDGQHKKAESGDIILINSESIHTVVPKKTETRQDIIALTLLIDDKFVKNTVHDAENCMFDIEEVKDLTNIKMCMQKILNIYVNDASEYKNIGITGLLNELFYELCTNNAKKNKSEALNNSIKDTQRIREILTYISENYNKPLKLIDVANQFYLSREYFSRYFKQYTGSTFKEYLILYRLKIAKEMIMSSEDSMTDIAIDTGFSDSRQLINYFKKYYKITPYQYKIKIREY